MVVLMRTFFSVTALLLLLPLSGSSSSVSSQEEEQTIDISVERFSFTPSQIRVKAGSKLILRLRSEDTSHGFHIPGTNIDIEVPKRGRGTVSVPFQPTVGRHTFECSILCGAGHGFMRGVIIATE